MKNDEIIAGIIAIVIIFFGSLIISNVDWTNEQYGESVPPVKIYYSSTCGCCENYAAYLESNGLEVERIEISNTNEAKNNFGIPKEMWSCHTTKIGNYFVEGHIPVEAILKLWEEKPQIDGIALPDMPDGSPGMPGTKSGPFVIYSISSENIEKFMIIE